MPAVRGDGMRGLAVFISDIRNCKSKEAEIKRINKEKIILLLFFKTSFLRRGFLLRQMGLLIKILSSQIHMA
jgi:hypothetical protein